MNKQERKLKGQAKFKRRIHKFGISYTNIKFRTTSTPCSCAMCSPGHAKVNGIKKKERTEYLFALSC